MMNKILPSDLLKTLSSYKYKQIPDIPNLSPIYLTKNFVSRSVVVGIIPTLIHRAVRPQNIMVLNPSRGPGGLATISGIHTLQAGIVGAGNTQPTPTGVANYLDMHLFLRVTAIAAGTDWTFFNQIQDPVLLQWTDSQVLVANVTPALVGTWIGATFYANLGTFGVGTNFALRWILNAGAGAIDFSLVYTLKFATIGSSVGVPQVIYVGANNGVNVINGYPILESSKEVLQAEEGTQIWGIALTPVVVNVIELN